MTVSALANHLRWLYAVEGLRPLTAGGREAVSAQVVNNDAGRKTPMGRKFSPLYLFTMGIGFVA